MASSKKILHGTTKKTSKQQSAIEYVLSYSWAIIILIAVLVIYFYYSSNQTTYASSYCYISPEFPCYQLLINSNSIGTSALIEFSNNVNKPLYFSSSSFSIKFTPNSQYYQGSCQPSTALQGERITCTISVTGLTLPIGSEISPQFYLTYSECISQNCNSNSKQEVSLTTSGSGLTYIYQYNSLLSTTTTLPTYTLNTYPSPTNGGTTSPTSGSYNSGKSVSISETPSTGYSFNDWTCTGTGCYSGTSTNPTIIMDANIVETASFNQLATYTLTTNSVPSNGGTVTPASGSYYSGTQVTISETPASGYIFTGWSCTGTGCYSGTTKSATITMNSDIVETANFQQSIATYTLTTNVNPTNGGTASPPSGSYQAGNTVIISETPASGYEFNDWTCTGIGCYAGTASTNTLTMSDNTVETANFNKQTGFYYPVPAYTYPSKDTYFYSNNNGGQTIGLVSDMYHNNVLNSIGSSYYESNHNYITVSRDGYVYDLSKFYNDGNSSFTAALVIINTSTESVVKEALIANSTANTTIIQGVASGDGYSMQFNSSGSLYILIGGTSSAFNTPEGPYLVIINKTDLQDAMTSSNLFYTYNKIQVKNLTNIIGSSASDAAYNPYFTSFIMLGNYAFISNSTNLYVLNTTKNNSMAANILINKFGPSIGSASGIINMVTDGNFMYFAMVNGTSSSEYNSSIASFNTTSLKINYTNVALSLSNYTVGATLSSNLTDLYVVLSNETVYTFPVSGSGVSSVKSVQNFRSTDPYVNYPDSIPLATGSQYNFVSSANSTDLYVSTTVGSGNFYEIYNLKSGSQDGVLGLENNLNTPKTYGNADIVYAPQNNYNIYTTGAQKSGNYYNPGSTNFGQVSIISSAYLINKENVTLPSTFSPTALLYDGNNLRIGGYNYTGNTINDGQALLTTANTTQNIVNSNIVAPEAQISYFYNSGYPMTPETSTYYLPMVADFSQPNGNFFSIYPSGSVNYEFYAQTLSQVFPTNVILSGMAATTSNSQAANCPSGGPCAAGNLYLTPYQTIDAFSSMSSSSGSVCAAEANYGFASTSTVYINGMLEKNNDMTVLSYQTQLQDDYSDAPGPAPGGMGATAAQIVFNYPLNDTIASTYNANGNSDTQTAAGTGDAGAFSCSSPPSPNEFITYSYWTVTDSGLLSQSTNSILTNPPVVPVNNTPYVYMLSPENGEVAIYNKNTNAFSTISLPHFNFYDTIYNNKRDAMTSTTNGTFVFVGYSTPFSNCAIATINTQLQKIVKINYDSGANGGGCFTGGPGEMIVSPDGKYLYSGIASVTNGGSVYSIYDLITYNSTFENGPSGEFNVSFANTGTFTLPIGTEFGYGSNGLGDMTYQRIAISTNAQPLPWYYV